MKVLFILCVVLLLTGIAFSSIGLKKNNYTFLRAGAVTTLCSAALACIGLLVSSDVLGDVVNG